MMKNQNRVRFLTEAGLIAAAYLALTALSALLGLAYGPVQLRFSEALCLLPLITPAAVPGLAVGCLLSNISSALGPIDMLLGTAATLLAAILTRLTRHVRLRKLPLLSALFPALCNGLIIGAEIVLFLPGTGSGFTAYLTAAAGIALSELLVCLFLGMPLALLLEKSDRIQSR